MRAQYIGLEPWDSSGDGLICRTPAGDIDLHGSASLAGFRVVGYPKLCLILEFDRIKKSSFSLQFNDVGDLRFEQQSVSSESWHETPPMDSAEYLDELSCYEYGNDLPPVFLVESLNYRFQFRAMQVQFIEY